MSFIPYAQAQKGACVKELLNMLLQVFGSKENILRNARSILVGITKVKTKYYDEISEEMTFVQLEDIEEEILNTEGMTEDHVEIMQCLRDCVFLYDPVDNGNQSWDNYESIKKKLGDMPSITNPGAIFQTVTNYVSFLHCHGPPCKLMWYRVATAGPDLRGRVAVRSVGERLVRSYDHLP